MDPRDRILGPIASLDFESDEVSVDFGDLVRKLILAEEVVLESIRLKEFPLMVRKLGYDGVQELLGSGRLRIQCEYTAIGSAGQLAAVRSRVKKGLLPLGSYSFNLIQTSDRREYIHECLQPINDAPGLRGKQAQRLRKAVATRVADPPRGSGWAAVRQLHVDIDADHPVLRSAVAVAASRRLNRSVAPTDFSLAFQRLDPDDVRTETNLGDRFGLDPQATHKIVQQGVLAAGSLNRRIELMERFDAVTGFRSGQLPLFEEKLSFLARQLDPDVARERLDRVIQLADLPDVSPDPDTPDVNMPRLLEILEGDEAREFRQWLRGIDSVSDSEIAGEVSSLRDVVAAAIRSPGGKGVRFATTTGFGLIPGAGLLAGPLAGALDAFVLEKLVPEPGPAAFLSRLYPSVFHEG